MDRLRWIFELLDRVSAPAKSAASSLQTLHSKLGDLQEKAGFASLDMAGLAAGVTAAGAAMLAATGAAAYAFGKMGVDALAFKENTLTSFKLMLGTQDQADAVFKQAVQMAKLSPWETTDVAGGFKALLAAGFSKEDVGTVFAGLSDVAAASGFDKAIINSMAIQMAQVKAAGKLQMVDLRVMANQMAQSGVGISAVYEKIAKNMGIGVAEVQDAMGRGEISADTGIFSILQAIQEHASGGQQLGTLTKSMSDNISGLFSTIKSAGEDFFLTLDQSLNDTPGFNVFKGFLMNLRDVLDTSTEAGKRFQSIVVGTFGSGMSAIFGRFSGPAGMQRLVTVLTAAVDMAVMAWEAFRAFGEGVWDAIKPMVDLAATMDGGDTSAQGLKNTMYALGRAAGYFADGIAAIVLMFGWFIEKAKQAEPYLNVFQAIMSPGSFLLAKGFQMGTAQPDSGAQALVADAEDKLEMHSPSKVFERMGAMSAEGFRLGMARNAEGFDAGAVVAPGGAEGGRAGGLTVNLNVAVTATGGAEADTIAARLGELLPTQLATVFDQLAAEMGA